MIPSRDTIMEKASRVPCRPRAIEAFWDGDTDGWFVVLSMICQDRFLGIMRGPMREYRLATLRGDGGDLRLFNDQVPPWPEALKASNIGSELAHQFGVPFFFASPEYPEDSCPRWWDRHSAYPCGQCGILLLQRDPCPWRGLCYHCHLASA